MLYVMVKSFGLVVSDSDNIYWGNCLGWEVSETSSEWYGMRINVPCLFAV